MDARRAKRQGSASRSSPGLPLCRSQTCRHTRTVAARSPEVLDRITRALAGRPSARVAAHRDAIRELVSRHHASHPRVFGSVARGDDDSRSDVDFVVDFTDDASLLDEVGLRLALRDLLQIEVDVVASDGLRGAFRDRVLSEAVPV